MARLTPDDDSKVVGKPTDLGGALAWELGDTFITCWTEAPIDQWRTIVRMLNEAGYSIVKFLPDGTADEQGDP